MAARERLSVTQEEFAELCGLSLTTVQRVEQGRVVPRAKTYSGLDRGAGWEPGSARAVLKDGRPPVVVEDKGSAPQMTSSQARARFAEMLAALKREQPAEYADIRADSPIESDEDWITWLITRE